MTRWAEGGNYRIELERGIVMCKVWSRPDVDRATGARYAEEKVAIFENLLTMSGSVCGACLLDAREAPTNWGPTTHAALARSVDLWERARRKIAIVASTDPLQTLLFRQLVKEAAPCYGRVFTDLDRALEELLVGLPTFAD
jgi:hypothetical protein